jgi:hypothetical protein
MFIYIWWDPLAEAGNGSAFCWALSSISQAKNGLCYTCLNLKRIHTTRFYVSNHHQEKEYVLYGCNTGIMRIGALPCFNIN